MSVIKKREHTIFKQRPVQTALCTVARPPLSDTFPSPVCDHLAPYLHISKVQYIVGGFYLQEGMLEIPTSRDHYFLLY